MAPAAAGSLYKILLLGDAAVGKTSFICRYADNVFCSEYMATLGVDYKVKTLDLNGRIVRLQIWDTAGQERFKSITTNYYRGANGICLFYDITNRLSFDNTRRWLSELRDSSPNTTAVLVATKSDLTAYRKVSEAEGRTLANHIGVKFFEASALTGANVDEVFMWLTEELIRVLAPPPEPTSTKKGKVKLQKGKKEKRRRC